MTGIHNNEMLWLLAGNDTSHYQSTVKPMNLPKTEIYTGMQ